MTVAEGRAGGEPLRVGDLVTLQTHAGPRPGRYVRPSGNKGWHIVVYLYPRPGFGLEGAEEGNAERRAHEDDIDKAALCRVCGCSEFFACKGGCSWVDDDLCSRCAS